jgi:hypothetical protein
MSQASLHVTVIIVTYNSGVTISRTLDSLKSAVENGLARCIVMENDSEDNTRALVTDNYPWVDLKCSGGNVGFGRAANLAFGAVETSYVLFLNPDATVESDALMALVRFMEEHPQAGVVAPATLTGNGAFQDVGRLITPTQLVMDAIGLRAFGRRKRPVAFDDPSIETEWVCGGIILIRSELFRRVGGFDPRFFLYFEEDDLLRRVRLEGYKIFAVGVAHAYHMGFASAKTTGESLVEGCIVEHFFRSRYYYLVKNHGLIAATLAELVVGLVESLRHVRRAIVGGRREASRNPFRRPFLRMPPRPEDSS